MFGKIICDWYWMIFEVHSNSALFVWHILCRFTRKTPHAKTINAIFTGMIIHSPASLMFTRATVFWSHPQFVETIKDVTQNHGNHLSHWFRCKACHGFVSISCGMDANKNCARHGSERVFDFRYHVAGGLPRYIHYFFWMDLQAASARIQLQCLNIVLLHRSSLAVGSRMVQEKSHVSHRMWNQHRQDLHALCFCVDHRRQQGLQYGTVGHVRGSLLN